MLKSRATKTGILEKLSTRYGKVTKTIPVSGGCINNGCCVIVGSEKYFLKWNSARRFPGMFEAEARGLALLQETNTLAIPRVMETGVSGEDAYILMEWMEAGRRTNTFGYDFGSGLARMHRKSEEKFGLDHDNYIGSLPQANTMHETWRDFFFQERLEPQLKEAIAAGALPSSQARNLEVLYKRISELIPAEPPALLHGDLWNGNYLVGPDGKAVLMDPAVYYGHREMDLAMTRLFGGFDEEFYSGYHEEYALQPGFESRIDIHNLYPLLVHVNLFGGGYAQQVKSILKRFL